MIKILLSRSPEYYSDDAQNITAMIKILLSDHQNITVMMLQILLPQIGDMRK
jgi:hypothetical protein